MNKHLQEFRDKVEELKRDKGLIHFSAFLNPYADLSDMDDEALAKHYLGVFEEIENMIKCYEKGKVTPIDLDI